MVLNWKNLSTHLPDQKDENTLKVLHPRYTEQDTNVSKTVSQTVFRLWLVYKHPTYLFTCNSKDTCNKI